jgi:hypothetical protein
MTKKIESAVSVGHSVVIESLEITDVNVISAALAAKEDERDLASFFVDVIEIGVKALQATGISVGVQQLTSGIENAEKKMAKSTIEAQERLQTFIEAVTADNGVYDKKFKAIVENFEKNIEMLATDEQSPIREGIKGQMSEMTKILKDDLAREATRQNAVLSSLVNPSDPSSPMHSLAQAVEAIKKDLSELRTESTVGKAVAEVINSSPMKGLSYEDQVVTRMQQLSGFTGDECIATGNTTGLIPKCKTGDGVIHLKPSGDKIKARIVIEAKNRPLSRAKWDEQISKGKQNRDATAYLGFCKFVEDMPNKNRVLVVDRQTVILAHNPEIDDPQMPYLVYQFVKMSALSASGHLNEDMISQLNDKLDDALTNIERFSSLSRDAKSIETTGKRMHTEINSLKSDLNQNLLSIGESLEVEISPLVLEAVETLELETGEVDLH